MQPYPGACKNGWSQHSLTRNGRHDPDGNWDIHPPWGLVALCSGPGDGDTEHHICLRRLICVLVRCDFPFPFNHLIPDLQVTLVAGKNISNSSSIIIIITYLTCTVVTHQLHLNHAQKRFRGIWSVGLLWLWSLPSTGRRAQERCHSSSPGQLVSIQRNVRTRTTSHFLP